MERELISKKELLELTGISYGQLYRWKRKQLIPEDWFIRKSTFTGQETFFPKELILARIEKIINLKEDLSLDELADKLSPHLYDFSLRKDEIIKRNIVSKIVMDRYASKQWDDAPFTFDQMLHFYVIDKLLQAGEMSLEEGELLLGTIREHLGKFQGKPCDLVFFRKMGVSAFALQSVPGELYFESGVKVVARLSISECMEELKIKLF
ncbi:YhbD family protein [Paenibacillus hamazuiensis]|uniref:YhbD family protein n=1 Tax=Paenibacillus hamazuiensis TaxID=2936508 RepID=UPI00200F0BDF|nr:YhbD family protein [Paenibacillus hamazuiensis]